MQSSKSHRELSPQAREGDAVREGSVLRRMEPRSFAPLHRRARGVAGTDADWEMASEAIRARDLGSKAAVVPDVQHAVGVAQDRAVIVIPCLNEAAVLRSVIQQVLQDTGLIDPLVLVVDGGSTDRCAEIVQEIATRDPRVRLLPNAKRLQSAGLNLAAASIEDRDWLVRVDAHADYPPNYASTLIAEARRTGAQSVVVSMETRGKAWFQRAVAAAQNSMLGTGGSSHRLATEGMWVDHGHHALFSLKAFKAAGGYDESFSHNEDAEFDVRLAQQGGRIWLTDKVRIGYYPRSTANALARQYFNYGKGRARTVIKHAAPLKIRQALPLAVAPAVSALTLAPFSAVFCLPALIWALAAVGCGAVLGFRARDPAALMSGPAAMIMHLAWSSGFWAQLIASRLSNIASFLRPRIAVAAT